MPSPKTQHLAGRSYRVIPLFPTVRSFLEAAWEEAPDGAEYVMPEEYRRRAQGPAGWANANLRTTLEKVVRRSGLEPWPRLWHSMRASCETDLRTAVSVGRRGEVARQHASSGHVAITLM